MLPILYFVFQLRSNVLVSLVCTVIFLLVDDTTAQLEIPSTWRKPTVDISKQLSIDIAAAALDKAYDEIVPDDRDHDFKFNMMLAEFDIATNQTRYKDKVFGYFNFNQNTKLPFGVLGPLFGYAAALAHIAYNDAMLLNIAIEAWDSNNNNVLSSTGVPPAFENNSGLRDALDKRRQCLDSADLTGGLTKNAMVQFEMVTSENCRVFRLSGLLYEITRNQTYLDAAQKYASLLLSQLYTDSSLFWWSIMLDTSDPCETSINNRVEPWNAGFALESLAILSSVGQNETIKDRHDGHTNYFWFVINQLDRLIASLSATSTYPNWHDSVSQGILKAMEAIQIVRGLATIHARNESFSSAVSSYVGSYLAVQYNAVLDKATTGGTNIYGNTWTGPANTTYSLESQLVAARVLVAGIGLALEHETPPPVESAPVTPPSDDKGPRQRLATIVGGVVGGLCFIALVIVGVLFIIRRRQRKYVVSPFMGAIQETPDNTEETTTGLIPSSTRVPETLTPPAGKGKRQKLWGRRHIRLQGAQERPPPRYSR